MAAGAVSLKLPNFLTTSQDVTKGADQAKYYNYISIYNYPLPPIADVANLFNKMLDVNLNLHLNRHLLDVNYLIK